MKNTQIKSSTISSLEVGQLRLMTRAARLHHVEGERQIEIAEKLGISQAGVSRLLSMAEAQGIIRKIVVPPDGLFPELEEGLLCQFKLSAAYVVDVGHANINLSQELGLAAAQLLQGEILDSKILGFTSWSSTLREMAVNMAPLVNCKVKYVAETLGDLGSPILQHEADVATIKMARALGAEPLFLRTPGVVSNSELRRVAEKDVHIRQTLNILNQVDTVLVGLGPCDFHGPLLENENFFSKEQLAQLRKDGAVGQLHQRFININGQPIQTELHERVVGMSLEQLRNAKKRIVIAGGKQKLRALSAALAGHWIDVLLTDVDSAHYLLGKQESQD